MSSGADGSTQAPGPLRTGKKRGKYGLRSCLQCHRRKIKCSGGHPCNHCTARRHECVFSGNADKQSASSDRFIEGSAVGTSTHAPPANTSSAEILHRLSDLARNLNVLNRDAQQNLGSELEGAHTTSQHRDLATLEHVSDITHSTHSPRDTSPLTNITKPSRWLNKLLVAHGIEAHEISWEQYHQAYFDEIHALFPFLHPLSVWRTFYSLRTLHQHQSASDLEPDLEERMSIAIVFLCMAIGRCTLSPRTKDTDERHASGWSMYTIGVHLMQDLLDSSQIPRASSLQEVQALLLLALYSFRVNINERARSFLGQANTRAHVFGIYDQRIVESLPFFQSELSVRTRCCLYVLDRIMTLETGLPYIITGNNHKPRQPLGVSDAFLEHCRICAKSRAQLEDNIDAEQAKLPPTPVPYLVRGVEFARLVGDIWTYSNDADIDRQPISTADMIELWETEFEKFRTSLPSVMFYRPGTEFERQFSGLEWWQIKQAMLSYMTVEIMTYLVQRLKASSIERDQSTGHVDEDCEAASGQHAVNIIAAFDYIPLTHRKHAVPFVWYLGCSTIILLSLSIKRIELREVYRPVILSAFKSLEECYTTTWIPEGATRMLSRLVRMARKIGMITNETLTFLSESDTLQSTTAAEARSWTNTTCQAVFDEAFKVRPLGSTNDPRAVNVGNNPDSNTLASHTIESVAATNSRPVELSLGSPHTIQEPCMQSRSFARRQTFVESDVSGEVGQLPFDLMSSRWLPIFPDELTLKNFDWTINETS